MNCFIKFSLRRFLINTAIYQYKKFALSAFSENQGLDTRYSPFSFSRSFHTLLNMAQRSMPSPVQEIYLWIVPLKGLSGPEDYFQKVAIEKSHMLDHEGFQIFLHWAIEVNRTIYEVSRSESPRKSSLSHPSGDYDISISPLSPWLSKREKSLTKRIKCGVTENSDSELNDIGR